jgi:hypothetical protein
LRVLATEPGQVIHDPPPIKTTLGAIRHAVVPPSKLPARPNATIRGHDRIPEIRIKPE